MGYDAAGVRARLAVDFGTPADGGAASIRPRVPERAPRSPRESRIVRPLRRASYGLIATESIGDEYAV